MTAEQNELMPANAEVLLTPEKATTLVSRGEVVNLIVVQYLDQMRSKIEVEQAEATRLHEIANAAWQPAYEAWYAEIQSHAEQRLDPWRDAVARILKEPMTDLMSEGLPHPSKCTYNTHGVDGPSRHRTGHSDNPTILDVLRAWNDLYCLGGRPKPNLQGPVKVSLPYGDKQPVNLAKFPMNWFFSLANAKDRGDWHMLSIQLDVTPSGNVAALIDTALEAHRAAQVKANEIGNLQNEVDDKNIKQLERRALAKLTLQALGNNLKFPALG